MSLTYIRNASLSHFECEIKCTSNSLVSMLVCTHTLHMCTLANLQTVQRGNLHTCTLGCVLTCTRSKNVVSTPARVSTVVVVVVVVVVVFVFVVVVALVVVVVVVVAVVQVVKIIISSGGSRSYSNNSNNTSSVSFRVCLSRSCAVLFISFSVIPLSLLGSSFACSCFMFGSCLLSVRCWSMCCKATSWELVRQKQTL